MAVKARAEVTVASIADVASSTRWYLLQSSTLNPPAKPTANPPAGWAETEPTYTEGSTNSLYFCDLTVFSDGSWSYSAVSLSSSYEAAKAAYNKAVAAANAAAAAQTFQCASNTAGGTAAKVPASTVVGFTLHASVTLSVKFTYANTAPNPTLNVNGTGAKAIMVDGANAGYWRPGSTLLLTFDGTYWQAVVPVYGSTSTIGNPAAGNVFTDEAGIKVRRGSKVLAEFGDEARVGTTEDAAIYAVVRSDGLHLASQGVDLAALKIIEVGWNVLALDVTSPMQVEGNLNVVGDLYLDAVKMGDFVIARSTAAPWTCTDWASGLRVVEHHGGLSTGALNATGNMYVSNVIEASVPAAMQPLALTGSLICADNDSLGIIGKTTTAAKVRFRVMSWYNTGSITAMVDMRLTGTWK